MRMAEVRFDDEGKRLDCTSRAASTHLAPANQSVELETPARAFDPLSRAAGSEAAPGSDSQLNIVILSDVRFVRDALVSIFEPNARFNILGACAEFGAVFERSIAADIVLIDTAIPDGFATVRRIRQFAPEIRVVALALAEREDEVLAWVESGVSGYIPRSAALNDVVAILEATIRGEQTCSPRVASGLVRRLASDAMRQRPAEPAALTRRELEIIELLNEGLTNKEIARRLSIGLATTKSHVHNLLAKLGFERRNQAAKWVRERTRATPVR
jgi:two-component system, NarL family, nitrate/nitrite response regulator NarL